MITGADDGDCIVTPLAIMVGLCVVVAGAVFAVQGALWAWDETHDVRRWLVHLLTTLFN